MKIGILGNKGFIGGHLTDHFINNGHRVVGIDNGSTGDYVNPKCTQIDADLCTYDQTKLFENIGDCDVILHLASTARVQPSFENPVKYFHNNIVNLTNVLDALHKNQFKGKFIYFSSSSVYGYLDNAAKKNNYEEDMLRPSSPYAFSKKICEDICGYYFGMCRMNVVIVRPFNVYGERMSTANGYSTLISNIVNHKGSVTLYGTGKTVRDFTHIEDFIQGLELVIGSDNLERVFNISTGVGYSVNQIFNSLPHDIDIIKEPAKPEPRRTTGNIDKLKVLGYKPKHNIIEWIAKKI